MTQRPGHRQVELEGVEVDEGMVPMLSQLWSAGIGTFASCENIRSRSARIWFVSEEGRTRFKDVVPRCVDVPGTGYCVDFPSAYLNLDLTSV